MKLLIALTLLLALRVSANDTNKWGSPEKMHEHFINEFINGPDFGFSRRVHIDMNHFKTLTVDKQQYRVKDMQLLSVTDRKKPTLWMTSGIIKKSHLKNKNFKHRPLKEDETLILQQLQKGAKILTAKKGNTLFMTGVLKANKGCIRCHENYQVGDLMGAFIYSLAPAFKKTVPEVPTIPLPTKKEPLENSKQG